MRKRGKVNIDFKCTQCTLMANDIPAADSTRLSLTISSITALTIEDRPNGHRKANATYKVSREATEEPTADDKKMGSLEVPQALGQSSIAEATPQPEQFN